MNDVIEALHLVTYAVIGLYPVILLAAFLVKR